MLKPEKLDKLDFENRIRDHLLKDLMLETLINLGVCYYKLGLLEDSLCCFDNCLLNLRNNK